MIIGRTKYEDIKHTETKLSKSRYFQIRDTVWMTLIECKIHKLPLELDLILNHYHISYCTYEKINSNNNINQDILNATKLYLGFTFIDKKNNITIYFNNNISLTLKRFTIAHEIGHIILKHQNIDNLILEKEANMFAARLLMPTGPLNAMKIESSEEIAQICKVSIEAATYRFKRLQMLKGRGKFASSPLEQKLLDNFNDYIVNFNYNK